MSWTDEGALAEVVGRDGKDEQGIEGDSGIKRGKMTVGV